MSTINAILRADKDGTVHLRVPAAWRDHPIKVKAELQPTENQPKIRAGLWKDLPGPFWMAADFDAPLEDFREYMQ